MFLAGYLNLLYISLMLGHLVESPACGIHCLVSNKLDNSPMLFNLLATLACGNHSQEVTKGGSKHGEE